MPGASPSDEADRLLQTGADIEQLVAADGPRPGTPCRSTIASALRRTTTTGTPRLLPSGVTAWARSSSGSTTIAPPNFTFAAFATARIRARAAVTGARVPRLGPVISPRRNPTTPPKSSDMTP